MIERRLAEPARARLPAPSWSRSSSPPTRPRTGRTSSWRRSRRASRASGCSAARAVGRSRPRTAPCASRRRRSSPSPTRMPRGRPTRCAARPQLRRPGRRLRLRPPRAHGRGRDEPRGRLLALRDVAARAQESALGSVTGGNGAIYAVRRSDYIEVDPRFGHDLSLPYAMVQRGRRAVYDAGGARVREADAGDRDRVPAQGAHVRALLADRPAREDAPAPAARVPGRDPLAPPPPLRVRAAPSAPARDERRARRDASGRGVRRRARPPGRVPPRRAGAAPGCRATTR